MRVYLDNNATAPIRPEVVCVMAESMKEVGNASSIHNAGRQARKKIEEAREQVADFVNAEARQVVFTSGATEANNMILKGYNNATTFVSAIEHPAVMQANPEAQLIPVTKNGRLDLEAMEDMLADLSENALVSVMYVNNETGVIQPLDEVSERAKKYGAIVHSDAVQAAGRLPLDFPELDIDYMSLSGHKFGGPQGVGALIFRNGLTPPPLLQGGGQERRARAGTENIAGILGFAEACRLAREHLEDFQNLCELRDMMEKELKKMTPQIIVYGQHAPRVSNTSCIGFPGVPAETLLMNLDLGGIAVSSGSACSSGVVKNSPVIRAMGAGDDEAGSTIRISMSWQTQKKDIDHFLEIWSKINNRLQEKLKAKTSEEYNA